MINEPWKDEPIIWEAFCIVRGWVSYDVITQGLYLELRSIKEEYDWFKVGYLFIKK